MNYKGLTNRILKNLRIDNPNTNVLLGIKDDVEDVLNTVFSISGTPQSIYEYDILDTDTEITMPTDMLSPSEVKFLMNGNKLYSKEMSAEEYFRWTPPANNTEVLDVIEDTSINVEHYTPENLDYDGYIGFYFSYEESGIVLHWKPLSSGMTVQVLYSSIPDLSFVNGSEIQMHKAFCDILVFGATLAEYRRRIGDAKTEIDLLKLQTAIKVYQPLYEKRVSDYIGFSHNRTEVPQVKAFSFLNDNDFSVSQ